MFSLKSAALGAAMAALCANVCWADTMKVGVIEEFSGPFAIYGKQYKEAIEVYVARHGNQAGEHTIEFIYKDVGRLFTLNAMAVASLIDQSETNTVIFNAATSAINKGSPNFLRSSYTLWQVSVPLAELVADRQRTVVLVDQRPAAALAFATHAVVIANGSIVYDGSATPERQPKLMERHIGVAHRRAAEETRP